MHFDEKFFEPEEKMGEKLCSMQKRFLASTMESLEEVDRICRKHNLKYYIFYGTLLGAVRHGGFIPWDDDVDVVFFRDDYEKFIEIGEREFKKPFMFYNEEQSLIFPRRMINTYYTSMQPDFLEQFHNCPYPTGLDIYVLDKMPTDPEEIETVRIICKAVAALCIRNDYRFEGTYGYDGSLNEKDTAELVEEIEKFSGEKLSEGKEMTAELTNLFHRLSKMYNNDDSDMVVRMPTWVRKPYAAKWPIDAFEPAIDMDFNGLKVRAPRDYDTVLKLTFGEDYMTPKRSGGNHTAWKYRSMEKDLLEIFKRCGATPPAFLFE